MDYVHM
jgi:serine/threonine protein kinase